MPRRKNDNEIQIRETGRRKEAKKPKRKWLELLSDITSNILQRLGATEILESAQKVCTAWRKICKDPVMWSLLDMRNFGDLHSVPFDLEKMCCMPLIGVKATCLTSILSISAPTSCFCTSLIDQFS